MEVEFSVELQSLTEILFKEFSESFSTCWEYGRRGNELSAMRSSGVMSSIE